MYHYRDSRGGDFYLDPDRPTQTPPGVELPLLQFVRRRGVALDLWSDAGADEQAVPQLLRDAGLDWRVGAGLRLKQQAWRWMVANT